MRPITRICLLLGSLALLPAMPTALAADAGDTAIQKAVLVTGASSGIGRNVAETLAANGYFVYAGARKQQDIDALNAIDNVQAIAIDVTIPEQINAAVQTVRAGGRGLYALINNAGVLITGPSLEVDVDRVERLFDVNVLGVYRVTQAFVPLLVESRGRILNMSSVAGNIGIPFLGAYAMSKHAIEAYTDVLAAEMQRFGVQVSEIAPGDYASNIWDGDIARARQAGVVAKDSPYADDYAAWIEMVASLETKPPDEVAATVLQALAAATPARRYLVVPNDAEMAWVTGSAVQRLAELNANHAHSYSREELTALLLDAMAAVEDSDE